MLNIGQRIQLSPASDRWMRGDRYGEIVGYTRYTPGKTTLYKVKLDKSGKTVKVHPDLLTAV